MSTSILRRVSIQLSFSRSRNEGFLRCARRMYWCLVFFLKGVMVGLRALRKEQLGSRVLYKNTVFYVSNWASSYAPTLFKDGSYFRNVPRDEIRSIIDAKELLHRFSFGMSFYLTNWHDIDVNEKM